MESIGKYRNSCPATDTSSTGDHPLSHKQKTMSPLDFQFTLWILSVFDRTKMLKVTNDQVALSNQIHQHMSTIVNQGLLKQHCVVNQITHEGPIQTGLKPEVKIPSCAKGPMCGHGCIVGLPNGSDPG
jgi:hypothetical protein